MTWYDKRGAKRQSWVDMQNANRVIEEEDRKEGRLHDKLDMVSRASIIDAQLRATEAAIGLERLQIEKAVLLKTHPDIYSERYPEEWDEHLKKTDYDGQWKQLHCHDQWKEENEDEWEEEFPELAEQEREKWKMENYHGSWKKIYYDKWCLENPKEAGMEAEIKQKEVNLLWKSLNYQKWCEQNPEEAKREVAELAAIRKEELRLLEINRIKKEAVDRQLNAPLRWLGIWFAVGFVGFMVLLTAMDWEKKNPDSSSKPGLVLFCLFFFGWCFCFLRLLHAIRRGRRDNLKRMKTNCFFVLRFFHAIWRYFREDRKR